MPAMQKKFPGPTASPPSNSELSWKNLCKTHLRDSDVEFLVIRLNRK